MWLTRSVNTGENQHRHGLLLIASHASRTVRGERVKSGDRISSLFCTERNRRALCPKGHSPPLFLAGAPSGLLLPFITFYLGGRLPMLKPTPKLMVSSRRWTLWL